MLVWQLTGKTRMMAVVDRTEAIEWQVEILCGKRLSQSQSSEPNTNSPASLASQASAGNQLFLSQLHAINCTKKIGVSTHMLSNPTVNESDMIKQKEESCDSFCVG